MFDIGFLELLLIFVVGLLVLGPERLPVAIRTISVAIGRMRRSFNSIREEIEREIGADDIRQQLHNEEVMASLQAAERELAEFKGDVIKSGEEAERDLQLMDNELRNDTDSPLTDAEAETSSKADKTP